MSQIRFHLVSKSEDADNKECVAEYTVAGKKVSIEFNDSQDAFNVDALLNLAYEAGLTRGLDRAIHLMQTALNNIR